MKKGWRIILVLVAICIAFGAVCAGVGVLTGADTERVGAIIERRCEDRYNLDLDAFLLQWIPEVAGIIQNELTA